MNRLLLTCAVVAWLVGCDRSPVVETRQEKAQTPLPPEPRLLASWSAYNYQPPFYSSEELLLYEDGGCALQGPAAEPYPVCRWRSDGENRLELKLGTSAETLVPLTGVLADSALNDLPADDAPCYLHLDFGRGHQRIFVLEGSRDAKMVRTAIEAEHAWTHQQLWKAIGKYQHAVDMGSPYARMRLGWILATTEELLDAQEAVALLEPMKDRDSYHVANALAAAYAAAGDFDTAVAEATRACRLARPRSTVNEECLSRLYLYRQQQPYLVSLKPDAANSPQ
jgi:hypothetical protein